MVDRTVVTQVLDGLKPLFLEHEGDFEVVDITDDGQMTVKLIGQCQICMYKEKTVRALEQMLVAAGAGIKKVEAE